MYQYNNANKPFHMLNPPQQQTIKFNSNPNNNIHTFQSPVHFNPSNLSTYIQLPPNRNNATVSSFKPDHSLSQQKNRFNVQYGRQPTIPQMNPINSSRTSKYFHQKNSPKR